MKKSILQFCAFVLAMLISFTCVPGLTARTYAQPVTADDGVTITSDDFEVQEASQAYWSDPCNYLTEGDNHYMQISKNGLLTNTYYNRFLRPTEMHLSMRVSSTAGLLFGTDGLNNGTPAKVYKGLWLYTILPDQMLGIWGYFAQNGGKRITTSDKNNTKTEDSAYIRLSRDNWVDISMAFDYSQWAESRTVQITYTISGKIHGIYKDNVNWFESSAGYDRENVYYQKGDTIYHIGDTFTFPAATYSYVFTGAAYDAYLQLSLGNPEGGNSNFSFDNFTATYDMSHAEVCAYIDTYKSVLDGSDTTESSMQAALDDYFLLPSAAQDTLATLYPDAIERLSAFAEGNNTDAEVTEFKSAHAGILALAAEDIHPDDADALAAAFAAYQALSPKGQFSLYNAYQHLLALQTALDNYIAPRPDGDLSDWIEDFSSGTTKNWVLTTQPNDTQYTYYADLSVVPDPDDSTNPVLQFNQCGGFKLLPNTLTWPEKGAMTQVSYRFRGVPGINNSYRHKLYVYYIDDENYAYVCVSGEISTYLVTVTGGQRKEQAQRIEEPLAITEWMDIITVYNNKKQQFTTTITDVDGKTIVWGGNLLNASGRFCIGQERNAMYNSGGYVDDIRISFTQGDWDVDDVITEIEPYYTGNVWMHPGDIVTFSGENLGKLTEKVQLIRVDDIAAESIGATLSYPGQQSYKYNPDADQDRHMVPTAALLQNYTFTEDDTVPLEQVTVDSIKFRIPEEQTPGIYAVKLTNNTGSDALIFINNPHLSYTYGTDGSSTPKGADLRIFGRNMLYDDFTKSRVALVDPDSGNIVTVLTPEKSEDQYSLHVTVPVNIAPKTYQVYLHNGFGDNTLWSRAGSITVTDTDIRSTWSDQIFDVTEYGAAGDLSTNDTPAFIAAMEAAAQNGGGIVYVPAGVYTLIHTITIPENVRFRGDGLEKTHIIWDVSTWDLGDARTLLSANSNIEICDISFYSSRRREILYLNGDNVNPRENIYVHDIRVKIFGLTETITQGSGNVGYDGAYTVAELRLMLSEELKNAEANFWTGGAAKDQFNLQFYNMDLYFDEAANVNGFKIGGYYNYLHNIQVKLGSFCWPSGLTYDYGIMEYCDFGHNVAVGLQGNNWYFAHNNFHDNVQNNRELYTTDGGCIVKDMIIKKDEGFSSGCVYNIVSRATESDLSGKMLMVASGQGYSQVRTIVSNTDTQIIFDQPFAVEPNRNSRCFVHNKRTENYFVENICENGGAFGSYGTMIDYVFDGNSFDQALGYNMDIWEQFIWGVSMIDSTIKDPFYTHGTSSIGGSDNQTRYRGVDLRVQGALYAGAMHNMLVRNIDFLEGARLEITLSGTGDSFKDLVVQGNRFNGADCAVIIVSSNSAASNQYMDGILLADNVYESCKEKFNAGFSTAYEPQRKNKMNDLKIKFVGEEYNTIIPPTFGDANNDAAFSLKDVSYVQYYLMEQILVEDPEDFKSRADVNGDGIVDLRDVNLMRKAILAGGWENIEMPDDTSSDIKQTYTVTLYVDGVVYDVFTVEENGTYAPLADVEAPQKEEFVFSGWYTAQSGGTQVTESSVVLRNNDHCLYALFTEITPEIYTLTYISDGVSIGSKTISPGDTYGSLPTPEKLGYKLKGWYLNAQGTGSPLTPETVVLNMSYSIYAVWEADDSAGSEGEGDLSADIVDDEDVFH